MARGVKWDYMAPIPNRVKVKRYSQGLAIETNNFAFEFKFTLCLESTCPDGKMAKIG